MNNFKKLLFTFSAFLTYSNAFCQVSFEKKLQLPNLYSLYAVASGDFDEDGDVDAAVLNGEVGSIAFFNNQGNGDLKWTSAYQVGGIYYIWPKLKAIDINADAHLDLVFFGTNNNVQVLTGTGMGTFGLMATISVANSPQDFAFGDFDNNGALDIVAICGDFLSDGTTPGQLSVIIGGGDGTFSPSTNIDLEVGHIPFSVVTGKFNADNLDDIALVNSNNVPGNIFDRQNRMVVMTNTGSTFRKSFVYQDLSNGGQMFDLRSIIKGKFNQDNIDDLAFADQTSNKLTVLTGNGNGTFSDHLSFNTQTNPHTISTADLNKDGTLDFITTNREAGSISVLNGTGGFGLTKNFAVGIRPISLVTDDFNGDSNKDVLLVDIGTSSLILMTNTGTGNLQNAFKQSFYGGGRETSVVSYDFNNDQIKDLIVANANQNYMTLLTGTGSGGFNYASRLTTDIYVKNIALEDVNKDGLPDVIGYWEGYGSINVFTFSGTKLSKISSSVVDQYLKKLAKGDFNKDGNIDFIAATNYTNLLFVITGNGVGGFAKTSSYVDTISGLGNVIVNDVNEDGKEDLIVAAGTRFLVYTGKGDGTFNNPLVTSILGSIQYRDLQLFDYNDDGNSDLFLSAEYTSTDNIMVWTGSGTGNFGFVKKSSTGGNGPFSKLKDVDGDNLLDAIQLDNTNKVNFLRGRRNGEFKFAFKIDIDEEPLGAEIEDFDADGKPDVAVVGWAKKNYITILKNNSLPIYQTKILIQPLSATICGTNYAYLSISASGTNVEYNWNNGIKGANINVSVAGLYWATVTGLDGIEISSNSTVTSSIPASIVSISPDKSICENKSASLSVTASGENLTYAWTNGISTDSFAVTTSLGTYFVTVSGCNKVKSQPMTISREKQINILKQPISQTICGSNTEANLNVSIAGKVLSYVWNSGQTVESINTTSSGTYLVTVNGICNTLISDPAEISYIECTTITGLSELDETDFSIFPNPSKGSFTINLDSKELLVLEIVDVLSQTVYSGQFYANQLIETPLKSGIYFIKINGKSKNIIKKIVVE